MKPEEIEASRKRLAEEVARKALKGDTAPVTQDEKDRQLAILAKENIYDLGNLIKASMEKLNSMAERSKEFSSKMRAHCDALKPVFCVDHPKFRLQIDYDLSFSNSFRDEEFNISYKECQDCWNARNVHLVNERIMRMGIPEKLRGATFDNFDLEDPDPEIRLKKVKALNKVKKQFEKGFGFLILRGTPGTGKSHLATSCLKGSGSGLFITQGDLIGELRDTYSKNSSQEAMVSKYRSATVLVLDELSIDVKGVDIQPLLYRILAHRYNNSLLSILTSNEPMAVILEILGHRLADRIRESYEVATMDWETKRKRRE